MYVVHFYMILVLDRKSPYL